MLLTQLLKNTSCTDQQSVTETENRKPLDRESANVKTIKKTTFHQLFDLIVLLFTDSTPSIFFIFKGIVTWLYWLHCVTLDTKTANLEKKKHYGDPICIREYCHWCPTKQFLSRPLLQSKKKKLNKQLNKTKTTIKCSIRLEKAWEVSHTEHFSTIRIFFVDHNFFFSYCLQ